MAFQITGKLLTIADIKQITEKFSVREVVLYIEKFYKKEDKSYPLKFQAINNKCIELDSLNIKDALRLGLNVMIDFEINGREDTSGRIWNSLNINSIVPSQTQSKTIKQSTIPDAPPAAVNPAFNTAPVEDDLPF